MKKILKYTCVLFLLCFGANAHAQMTFELKDMTRINATQWRYGTVNCTSPNNITSIILSMVNNQVTLGSTVSVTETMNSLGVNPRTELYLFTPALTPAQVKTFIEEMKFTQTNEVPGANPYVNISVDANPTSLPGGGSKITAWKHPDGSTHYYVWVPSSGIDYGPAYTDAKKYYFQGMRGYMATVTSAEESALLTNISSLEGWSGGARTTDTVDDTRNTISNPTHSNSGIGIYYRWLCGPETNFRYYQGPRYDSSGGGPMNNAFSGWNPTEPNDSNKENCMQVNHTNLRWNDYYAWNDNIKGYFVEFGGTGKPYVVGSANYPANPLYDEDELEIPAGGLTNDQWHGFSKGNKISTSTTFKPNSMRANVLVIE